MNSEDLINYILKNNLIINILEKLGCHKINTYGKDIRCALPDHDDPSKISINPNTLRVRVFTKGESIRGNIYSLIMHVHSCEFLPAFQWCCNTLGIVPNKHIPRKDNPLSFFKKIKKKKYISQEQIYYDASILNSYLSYPHIDLIKRDGIIDSKILKKYSVRFDERSERILFPHFKHDDSTKVLGIIGRTLKQAYKELKIPKYLNILDTEYIKQQNLYALNLNIIEIKNRKICIVFESEKSVMKADMFGYPIGVAVGCHELSNFQKKLLIELDVEICIAYDKDVEIEHIINTCKSLYPFRRVSYIHDKWNLLKEKDSPVDRGYKRWEFLFKHRIVYKE